MTEETLNMDFLSELTLTDGVGDYDAKRACIMSACVAKWRLEHGEPLGRATDDLECVCPVIRRLAIKINDMSWWKDDAERTAVLMPFVDKILNTKDAAKTLKRGYICADTAVREIAPRAFDQAGLSEHAVNLRAVAPVVDKSSAEAARDVCRTARSAARDKYAADAAAYAAAYAADAADDAAAADAAYAAAAYAAYAADAAAYAADAAAAAAADADAADAAAAAAAAAADAADDDADDADDAARASALALLTRLCEVE